MVIDRRNPWEVLGIAPTGDISQVRKAYAVLIKQYRPESHPEAFSKIRHAYEWACEHIKYHFVEEDLSDDEGADFVGDTWSDAGEHSPEPAAPEITFSPISAPLAAKSEYDAPASFVRGGVSGVDSHSPEALIEALASLSGREAPSSALALFRQQRTLLAESPIDLWMEYEERLLVFLASAPAPLPELVFAAVGCYGWREKGWEIRKKHGAFVAEKVENLISICDCYVRYRYFSCNPWFAVRCNPDHANLANHRRPVFSPLLHQVEKVFSALRRCSDRCHPSLTYPWISEVANPIEHQHVLLSTDLLFGVLLAWIVSSLRTDLFEGAGFLPVRQLAMLAAFLVPMIVGPICRGASLPPPLQWLRSLPFSILLSVGGIGGLITFAVLDSKTSRSISPTLAILGWTLASMIGLTLCMLIWEIISQLERVCYRVIRPLLECRALENFQQVKLSGGLFESNSPSKISFPALLRAAWQLVREPMDTIELHPRAAGKNILKVRFRFSLWWFWIAFVVLRFIAHSIG